LKTVGPKIFVIGPSNHTGKARYHFSVETATEEQNNLKKNLNLKTFKVQNHNLVEHLKENLKFKGEIRIVIITNGFR
jgi:hypothetical protein